VFSVPEFDAADTYNYSIKAVSQLNCLSHLNCSIMCLLLNS